MERIDPPVNNDEMANLRAYLGWVRSTVLEKTSGIDAAGMRFCLTPSLMSPGGILKHLALVEDHWFGYVVAGGPPSEPWASVDWDDDPDWEWRTAADDGTDYLRGLYADAIARSDSILDAAEGPDSLAARSRGEETPPNLRWVILHVIRETSRHVGHLDLLREQVDGSTGE